MNALLFLVVLLPQIHLPGVLKSHGSISQLYVWNRSGHETKLVIRVNDVTVYDAMIASNNIGKTVEAADLINLPAGSILSVTDLTHHKDIAIEISKDHPTPNVGIHIRSDGLAIVIAAGQYLSVFTPGP